MLKTIHIIHCTHLKTMPHLRTIISLFSFLKTLSSRHLTVLFHLQILKLSACKFLSDSSLDALFKEGALPALRELDLSYSSIGQSAILGLLACCTNLVNLNLNGCAYLHDLQWGSGDCQSSMNVDICLSNSVSMGSEHEVFRKTEHFLEILNCIGCPNMKKVTITSSACCFHLSKINLNLSINLKEVDLVCFNLSSLNLRLVSIIVFPNCLFYCVYLLILLSVFFFPSSSFSNCCSLEILKLDCPRLTNLQLLVNTSQLHDWYCMRMIYHDVVYFHVVIHMFWFKSKYRFKLSLLHTCGSKLWFLPPEHFCLKVLLQEFSLVFYEVIYSSVLYDMPS